jgi:hypothetical protein
MITLQWLCVGVLVALLRDTQGEAYDRSNLARKFG